MQHPHLSAAQLAQLETESWHENPTKDQRRQRHYQKIKSFRTGVQVGFFYFKKNKDFIFIFKKWFLFFHKKNFF